MNGECVLWSGSVNRDGYGVSGKALAHRAVWIRQNGPVPKGLELDHLCRNRRCVNPTHLEPVTHAENVRRSYPATKDRCASGHHYDEANTYHRLTGGRDCRACMVVRVRRYRERKGEAA